MLMRILAVSMVMVFVFAGAVMAQEDAFHLEGSADGDYPVDLAPTTEYEFAFEVFNDAGGDVAIKTVSITLPTTSYVLGDYDEMIEGVRDGFQWQGTFDEDTATLEWATFGPGSSAELGDIQEGDMLTFAFFATTDEEATDGFAWVLTGDDNGATTASGVLWFSGDDGPIDGDDDDDDDDDDSGCGC